MKTIKKHIFKKMKSLFFYLENEPQLSKLLLYNFKKVIF